MANADFAPRLGFDKPENMMNFSRGFETAAGAIGQGIGEAGKDIGNAIKVADTAVKVRIEEETRDAVEDANYANYGVQADPQKQGKDVPPELALRFRKLERMKSGVDQGKIPDGHYWQYLHKESKDIRSRYSGYADEIDGAFTQLTGTTPAKALIKEIQVAEATARAAAATTSKRNAAFIDSFIKSGYAPPKMAMRLVQPGAADDERLMAEARLAYGQAASFKTNMELKVASLNLDSKERAFKNDRAAEAYRESALTEYQTTVVNTVEYKDLQALQTRARQEALNGGSVTKGTEEQLTNLMGALRAKVQSIKDRNLALFNVAPEPGSPTLASRIPKDIEEVHKFMDENINAIERNLTNENFGALSLNQTILKNMDARNALSLRNASATAEAIATVEKTLGKEAAQRIWQSPTGTTATSEIAQYASAKATVAIANKEVESLTQQYDNMKIRGELTPEASRKIASSTIGMLRDSGIEPRTYVNLVEAVVGPKNGEFFSRIPQEARTELFQELSSPAVYSRMKEYARSTGRADILDMYKKFTFDAVAQVGRTSVDRVNELNASSSTVRIQFNQDTNRFEVQRTDPTASSLAGRVTARAIDAISGDANYADRSVRELNGIVANLDQVAQAEGANIKHDMPSILQTMGFDPSIVKQGNIIDRLNRDNRGQLGREQYTVAPPPSSVQVPTDGGGPSYRTPDTQIPPVPSRRPEWPPLPEQGTYKGFFDIFYRGPTGEPTSGPMRLGGTELDPAMQQAYQYQNTMQTLAEFGNGFDALVAQLVEYQNMQRQNPDDKDIAAEIDSLKKEMIKQLQAGNGPAALDNGIPKRATKRK